MDTKGRAMMKNDQRFIRAEDVDTDDLTQKANHWYIQWKKRLLSTEPADRARVERGIRYVLHYMHTPSPVPIIWVDSPATMAVIACAASTIYASQQHFANVEAMNAFIYTNEFHRSLMHSIERELIDYWEKSIDQRIIQWGFHTLSIPVRQDLFDHSGEFSIKQLMSTVIARCETRLNNGTFHHAPPHSADGLSSVDEPLSCAYRDLIAYAIDCALGQAPSHEKRERPAKIVPLDEAAAIAIDAALHRIAHSDREKKRYCANLSLWWGMHSNAISPLATHDVIKPFYHSFFPYAFGVMPPKLLEAYCDLLSTGWICFTGRLVVVCEPPTVLKTEGGTDGSFRLHATDGPSVVWRDGTALWSIHGVCVPRNVAEAPETITLAQINQERNTDVRRIMIERRLHALGATVRHEDTDRYGFPRRLLVAGIGGVEPLCVVEIVNPTPEPIRYRPKEGERGLWVGKRWHKKHMLCVPPQCQTTQEALTWAFEAGPWDYRQALET
jgi:hypothetical protein